MSRVVAVGCEWGGKSADKRQVLARVCAPLLGRTVSSPPRHHMATPASSGRLCHAGQLLKFGCHVEPSSWRRVCTACMEAYSKEGLNVPAARCRYLSGPCGSFGGGRNFFSSWSTSAGVFEGVRALRLAGDSRLLLVFLELSLIHISEPTRPY